MSRALKRYTARRITPLIVFAGASASVFLSCSVDRAPSTDRSDLLEQMLDEMDRINSSSQEDRVRALSSLGQLARPMSNDEPDGLTASDSTVIESDIVPVLLALVASGNPNERTLSLSILEKLLSQGMIQDEGILRELESVFRGILTDLNAEDYQRLIAVDGLRALIPLSPETLDELLLTLTQEPTDFLRRRLAALLAEVSVDSPEIKEVLFDLLQGEDERLKVAIIGSIGFMGNQDDVKQMARTATVESLSSRSKSVRREALRVLMSPKMFGYSSIDDRDAVRDMINNDSEDREIRTLAVKVLGRMSSSRQNQDGIYELVKFAGDRSYPTEVRETAVRSLPFASHYSLEMIEVIEPFTADSDPKVVEAANWAISAIERDRAMVMEAIRNQK